MIKTAPHREFDLFARQIEQAMDEVSRRHFSQFSASAAWAPAINAYRLEDRIEVCVDLAGVDRSDIDIDVAPDTLTIRGVRLAPQPPLRGRQRAQVLAMEIDHGRFERTLKLPRKVDLHRVSAEQRNGLLWISLPICDA